MSTTLQTRMLADLQRQSDLLPREVAVWKQQTETNVEGLGIHQTQIEAVSLMLDVLRERQTNTLAALTPNLPTADFASQRQILENELSGTHGIVNIFRHILMQRSGDSPYRDVLDAADLIAASCYRPCIMRARNWSVLTLDQFRPPPLTYLTAITAAGAITRTHRFQIFGFPLQSYREQRLPISVLSLPFFHTVAIWHYSVLYHEVAHPLDQDLQLAPALLAPLRQGLVDAQVDASRIDIWLPWLREILADAIAVLFGGEAFAYSLMDTLFAPPHQATDRANDPEHPTPYVRLFLLAALLRAARVPNATATADAIEQETIRLYGEASGELQALCDDCKHIAPVMLDTKLAAIKQHSLRELVPSLEENQGQLTQLVLYLQSGDEDDRPDPEEFPIRLVPAAAQLATRAVNDQHQQHYAAIHTRALEYIKMIPRPQTMGGNTISPARAEYLRNLVRQYDFGDIEIGVSDS
jgi:hypothetical protein